MTTALHFRNLNHPRKLHWVNQIAKQALVHTSVCIHKPSIQTASMLRRPEPLYYYATRLLLERVSWYCRDAAVLAGTVSNADIVFSDRSRTSYPQLSAYLQHLQSNPTLGVQIDWTSVDPKRIRTTKHVHSKGLQIADAIASSLYTGLEFDHFGNTEPRYGMVLRPCAYTHGARCEGYGLKLFPVNKSSLIASTPVLAGLLTAYQ